MPFETFHSLGRLTAILSFPLINCFAVNGELRRPFEPPGGKRLFPSKRGLHTHWAADYDLRVRTQSRLRRQGSQGERSGAPVSRALSDYEWPNLH